MAVTVTARIVRVKYDGGDAGLFFATSPDLRGLLVAKHTMDELVEAVPQAIRELYAADGIDMIVHRAPYDDPEFFRWIATPVEIARQQAGFAAR
jgi:Domain of unknown function (DUF1902)